MKNVVTTSNKKTIARRISDSNAEVAIQGFGKETRVTGLTNGAFSLIGLIKAALEKTGKANVIVSTWSSGVYDAHEIKSLMDSDKIGVFNMILDRSFKTRQQGYTATMLDLFKPENIRTTDTHSKFVLIWNEEWTVCIRSSMNLNENKRCENFDIDNDNDIFNCFKQFADDLFRLQPKVIIEDRRIVDPVFKTLFNTPNEDLFDFKPDFDFNFKFGD